MFDWQEALDPEKMDAGRLWVGSRFVTMRGTVAFERLSCGSAAGPTEADTTWMCGPREETYARIRLTMRCIDRRAAVLGQGSRASWASMPGMWLTNRRSREISWRIAISLLKGR